MDNIIEASWDIPDLFKIFFKRGIVKKIRLEHGRPSLPGMNGKLCLLRVESIIELTVSVLNSATPINETSQTISYKDPRTRYLVFCCKRKREISGSEHRINNIASQDILSTNTRGLTERHFTRL